MNAVIRNAGTGDLPRIAEIYAEAVAHGTASFELTVPDLAEMTRRFETITAAGYPYLVAEAGGTIAGYAYAGAFRARPAYRWSVENSIYLDERFRGQGIGKRLLRELIHGCTRLGFRQMLAVIGDSANHGSIGVHRACGFEMVGTFRDVGWKHGKWLDVVFMQLSMGDAGATPADTDSVPGRMYDPVKTP